MHLGLPCINFAPFCFLEYVVTMFDTKTQELRWNATYNDYSAPPYDEKQDYSTSLASTPPHTHSLAQTDMAGYVAGLLQCKCEVMTALQNLLL